MSGPIKHLSLALSGLVFAAALTVRLVVPAASAQQFRFEPPRPDGVLLLRNGNVLEGKITQVGESYEAVVDGGRVRVKASEVELCCPTLEEGYRRKRSLVQPGDVRGHLELAQWCQRHGLLAAAAGELAQARALEPRHPLISMVERRIRTSLYQPERIEWPVERGVKGVDPPPSSEELDRLVRGMPPGSVETFTQTVQPVLANNCSMAGCHGPDTESRFRLLRTPSGRPASRRLTQRNLHSTLEWIDRDTPAASRLLTAPIRPHGSAQAAVFTDQQVEQYQQLVDWVNWVAQSEEPGASATHESKQALPRRDVPPWPTIPAVHTDSVESAGDDSPHGGLGAYSPGRPTPYGELALGASSPPPDRPGTISSPTVKPSASMPRFVPVDPFDPAIFNRRFFPESRSPAHGQFAPGE